MSDESVVAEVPVDHSIPGKLAEVDARVASARSRNASVEELEALQQERNDITGEGGEESE